ncbi:MAG TPA: GNAT family N-acetyltransferase [Baekduia sp.]|uniref:GNAT family N-acetyltransferase n=1 Tax=Baekduia sp. TaxID=2600305 RepID=UPI002D768A2B|nr:GNAT family N-acetyltransferase [Baekduia sp.]HET6506805.1 GNAT family N-acetyltransferase [Baekduia sp.]
MPVPRVDLPLLDARALEALVRGDLEAASAAAGVALPAWFSENELLWTLRFGQLVGEPGHAPWLTRVVVDAATGTAVGLAGFHGPPDERGMVEIGYEISPEHRRRGFGRAAVAWLVDHARADGGVAVVRASVAPGNVASLALVDRLEFVQVGEQLDEVDGRELVFERKV